MSGSFRSVGDLHVNAVGHGQVQAVGQSGEGQMPGGVGDAGCRGVGFVHCDESGERVGHVAVHLRVISGYFRPVDRVCGGVGEWCDGFEVCAGRDLPDLYRRKVAPGMAKSPVPAAPESEAPPALESAPSLLLC